MAQEFNNKLKQLKALLAEMGESEEYNMFVVVEDPKRAETMSGLCGKGNDLKTALCYAYDCDIVAFKLSVTSFLTYAIANGTLEKDSDLINRILALMYETVAATRKETNEEEDNG